MQYVGMEQRSHPRFDANEPVHVTVLSEPEALFSGRLTNYSTSGIGLWIDGRIPFGSVVRVEWSDGLLIGEVCYCSPRDGGYSLGLKMERPLYDSLQLAILARQLHDEQPEALSSVRRL